MIDLLRRRHLGERSGNGPAWAFVPGVRNAAGFAATRTADAIAMSLWPSRGLELHGFEIKCSRSDWIRELKNPAKAEQFMTLVDRWWLVVADAKIVQPGELPDTWGLLAARGGKLVQIQEAKKIQIGEPIFTAAGRSFLAALLRSAARTHDHTPQEVQEAITAALERERTSHALALGHKDETIATLRGRLDKFKETFGVGLGDEDDTWLHGGKPASEVGAALRLVLDGEADVEMFETRLAYILDQTERVVGQMRKALGREAAA